MPKSQRLQMLAEKKTFQVRFEIYLKSSNKWTWVMKEKFSMKRNKFFSRKNNIPIFSFETEIEFTQMASIRF